MEAWLGPAKRRLRHVVLQVLASQLWRVGATRPLVRGDYRYRGLEDLSRTGRPCAGRFGLSNSGQRHPLSRRAFQIRPCPISPDELETLALPGCNSFTGGHWDNSLVRLEKIFQGTGFETAGRLPICERGDRDLLAGLPGQDGAVGMGQYQDH